eukprot:CAMPEP_0170754170 /NCGR_PEP_ID=MMETSP0437-20130122/12866_1 /TAXON_ID=0 /ORGANISM="Sexangularia sp." /LENGTH=61 /DNA_ID=CAMNT_0011093303 /DNA_START=21 /DNA_END=202 /DNA_ORIENTATION=+
MEHAGAPLVAPDAQRPYEWTEKKVSALFRRIANDYISLPKPAENAATAVTRNVKKFDRVAG